MIVYKLCRKLKSGEITSLFINKKRRLPFNEWMESENHPTGGFAVRPYWHCTSQPVAPHLSEKNRVWVKCEIEDYQEFIRPESQGGKWYLANKIKLLEIYNSNNPEGIEVGDLIFWGGKYYVGDNPDGSWITEYHEGENYVHQIGCEYGEDWMVLDNDKYFPLTGPIKEWKLIKKGKDGSGTK